MPFGMGFSLCYFQVMIWFGWVLIIAAGLIGIGGISDRMNIIEIKTFPFSLERPLKVFK